MKRVSRKRAARMDEVRDFRNGLIDRVGHCERCKVSHRILERHGGKLSVHEIANGPLRDKALDKPYAVLVLCWKCNQDFCAKGTYPQSMQLSILKESRPEDYDLVSFNHLVNPNAPNRITQEEVDEWLKHSN
jgi:hypothetical protein